MSAQGALEGSQVGVFPAGPAGPRRGPFQACVPPLLCEGQAKYSSELLLGEHSGRFWNLLETPGGRQVRGTAGRRPLFTQGLWKERPGKFLGPKGSPSQGLWSRSRCLVAKSCPPLCDSMGCSPPGSSVLGILQARVLEVVAVPFSRGIFPSQGSNLRLPGPGAGSADDGHASFHHQGTLQFAVSPLAPGASTSPHS